MGRVRGSARGRALLAGTTLLVVAAGLTAFSIGTANAANPIIANRFIADPSAHVFNNRMYIYATDDETNSGTYWDSTNWRAYSSTDLVNWTNHNSVFAINGGFTWASQYAWAPSAANRNGFYYLYLPVDRNKIGVARSASPTSGFSDPRGNPLLDRARDANTGNEPIDPMVFIDDDGRAYMYFGSRTPKVVQLGADMISMSGAIRDVSVSRANYAEAPYLHKRNGTYYFSYSTGWPGQIAYATGTSPLGPFTYRGIVLDFVNVNTNHASILQYNGQWFVVYHKNIRSGGGNYKRAIVMDYLYYNADGTIRQVVQTTTGVVSGTVPPPTGYSTLTARHSGRRANVSAASTADGATLVQSTAGSAASQQWQLSDAGGGYYTVVNRNSGKCMDVAARSTADGAAVIQYACGTGTNQQWQPADAGGGYVRLVARHSGKCLDVTGGGTADGTALIQYTCGSGTNQQWLRAAVS